MLGEWVNSLVESQGVSPNATDIDEQLNEVECHIKTLREQLREVTRRLAELRLKRKGICRRFRLETTEAQNGSLPELINSDPSACSNAE
jgi:archaellum component FlaC